MIHEYSNPAPFLHLTRTFLETSEMENTLLLGISSWLTAHPEQIVQPSCFLVLETNGNIRGAAILTPRGLILSRIKKANLDQLLSHMSEKELKFSSVEAPQNTARTFAELWSQKMGYTTRLYRTTRLYELTNVIPPAPKEGQLRQATKKDRSLVYRWMHGFSIDIRDHIKEKSIRERAAQMLVDKRPYFWEDSVPRSMAAWGGPTAHGIRISAVYTPPEFRGRGYASVCVAALSQAMLRSGKDFCCLFADRTNPVSNRLYQRIGYRPVCDFAEYHFS